MTIRFVSGELIRRNQGRNCNLNDAVIIGVSQIRGQAFRKEVPELIIPRKFLFASAFETTPGYTVRSIECNDRHAAGPPIDDRRRGKTKEKKKTTRRSAAIYPLRQFSSIARVRSSARDLPVCERRNRSSQFADASL